MTLASRLATIVFAAMVGFSLPASAQQRTSGGTYAPDELVGAGHRFFGDVSQSRSTI